MTPLLPPTWSWVGSTARCLHGRCIEPGDGSVEDVAREAWAQWHRSSGITETEYRELLDARELLSMLGPSRVEQLNLTSEGWEAEAPEHAGYSDLFSTPLQAARAAMGHG